VDSIKLKAWVKQAERDLKYASYLLNIGEYEWVYFAAHRAALDAVKALALNIGSIPKGDSVQALFRRISEKINVPRGILEDALFLDAHYMPFKYPDFIPEETVFKESGVEEAEQAFKKASKIVAFVKNILG